MERPPGLKPLHKVLLLYVVFMILYGAYRTFPVFPLSIISGTTESNFQHYKAAFFTFLIVGLIEFLVFRKRIGSKTDFWYGRLLTAVIAPWVIFLLWYIAPAIYGRFPNVVLEIIYANVTTILALICVVILERSFLQMPIPRELKIVVWVLLLVSLLLYMVFTFSHLPWADVFVEPQWR